MHAYMDCKTRAGEPLAEGLWKIIETLGGGQDLAATIAIDHVEESGQGIAEEVLMALYNALNDSRSDVPRRLLVAHRQPASAVSFTLADLNSRMRAMAHHQPFSLTDAEKTQVLRIRAEQRGYHMSGSVAGYWLRRGPRGLDQLLADLERLDAATLQHKRLSDSAAIKICAGLLTWLGRPQTTVSKIREELRSNTATRIPMNQTKPIAMIMRQ